MQEAIKQKIYEKWMPRLEKKFKEKGYKIDEAKLRDLAEMAHSRQMFESSYATLDGVNGRGDFSFGNNPSSGPSGFYGNTKGSGEVMSSLFNVFLETVHHCVAFDFLPTVPQSKSSGVIYIMEPVYGGGKLGSATKKPLMIQVAATLTGNPAALVVGTEYTLKTANSGGENIAKVTFVGIEKIKGNYVFRIGEQYDNSGSSGTNWQAAIAKDLFDSATNNSGIYTSGSVHYKFDGNTVDLVQGFSNFIPGYSGAGTNDDQPWYLGRNSGKSLAGSMSATTGEKTYYRSMGVRTWNRNFKAGTVHVDIEYTTEQIQDAKNDHGVDLQSIGDKIMANELTQHINDDALTTIFSLGWSNHYQMVQAGGPNLNIAISTTTGNPQTFVGKEGSLLTIAGPAGSLPASGAISENLSTIQRRLITRIQFASDVINHRSRRGRGDTAVMNTTLGTAIKDIKGYEPAKFPSTNNGNVYYAGKIYDIDIYVDPLMDLSDFRVCVFRKGAKDDPGLKMAPYLLAEKITTIAEGTMAPKSALKSRYSLVPAGSFPELNYLTFTVESASGYSMV